MTTSTRLSVATERPVMPRLARTSPCMQRVDRLGWTAALVVDAYGVRLGVRSDSAGLLRRAEAQLPPGAGRVVGSPVVDRLFSLYSGARDALAGARPTLALYDGPTRTLHTSDRDDLLDWFESTARIAVADMASSHLFLHAGVVGYRDRAILVAGRSLSGKTTLVRALLALGATYYSDDVAVIDADGWVHPYAKPLAIRAHAGAPQRQHAAAALGATIGHRPLRVGLVACTDFRAGAAWRPRTLTGGAATLALVPHAAGVQRDPARVFATLGATLRGAAVVRGPRGEADATARALLRAAASAASAGRAGTTAERRLEAVAG